MEFFQTSLIVMVLWLFVGHALGDFALQNDYVANAKNPKHESNKEVWAFVMSAHCLMHAGIVALITGSWVLGILEFVTHFFLDIAKCENQITYKQDQIAHYVSKVIWVALFYSF